jgi:hypothetical protein
MRRQRLLGARAAVALMLLARVVALTQTAA